MHLKERRTLWLPLKPSGAKTNIKLLTLALKTSAVDFTVGVKLSLDFGYKMMIIKNQNRFWQTIVKECVTLKKSFFDPLNWFCMSTLFCPFLNLGSPSLSWTTGLNEGPLACHFHLCFGQFRGDLLQLWVTRQLSDIINKKLLLQEAEEDSTPDLLKTSTKDGMGRMGWDSSATLSFSSSFIQATTFLPPKKLAISFLKIFGIIALNRIKIAPIILLKAK